MLDEELPAACVTRTWLQELNEVRFQVVIRVEKQRSVRRRCELHVKMFWYKGPKLTYRLVGAALISLFDLGIQARLVRLVIHDQYRKFGCPCRSEGLGQRFDTTRVLEDRQQECPVPGQPVLELLCLRHTGDVRHRHPSVVLAGVESQRRSKTFLILIEEQVR